MWIVTLTRSRWASNYYITPATGSSEQLERRCWNENHVPAEAGPPGPQLSSQGEQERNAVIAWRVGGGVNMLQFCSVSNSPLTVKPFVTRSNLSNKVRGIFFWRTVSARLYCVEYISTYICIWVCYICIAAHPVILSSLDPSVKMCECLGYFSLIFSSPSWKISGWVLFLWNLQSVKIMFGVLMVQGGTSGMIA